MPGFGKYVFFHKENTEAAIAGILQPFVKSVGKVSPFLIFILFPISFK